MNQPITHSAAFQKRNQDTHRWTDGSQLMSRSLPSNSFLHRSYGSSASSPRSSRDASSEKTSPAGKSTRTRPSSSYSYDGGFFVGAHTGKAEYFVIHPDWVSEAITLKKYLHDANTNGPPLKQTVSLRAQTLHGRRCLSAPPKSRNPITWGQNYPIHIPPK